MQKNNIEDGKLRKEALTGGATNEISGGGDTTSKPLDPDALNMALPIAAIMLAGYGGYKLANTATDKKAAEERQQRIRENLNKLSRANLEYLKAVRGQDLEKQASLIGTMFNPFQGVRGMGGKMYAPSWFRPTGGKTTSKADHLIFKTLALAGTYGTMAAAIKYLTSAMERAEEARKSNKGIASSIKATMPVVSPDPVLGDLDEEERKELLGIGPDVMIKEAAGKETGPESTVGRIVRKMSVGYEDPKKGTWTGTAKALAWLIGLGSFGAGAVLTKKWADERDENRQRIKAAEKAAKRMAMISKPPAIVGDIDPEVKRALDQHIGGGSLRVRPKLEAGALEEQEVDPTDTLNRNIASV